MDSKIPFLIALVIVIGLFIVYFITGNSAYGSIAAGIIIAVFVAYIAIGTFFTFKK